MARAGGLAFRSEAGGSTTVDKRGRRPAKVSAFAKYRFAVKCLRRSVSSNVNGSVRIDVR
jgi:hypothetical protein